MLQDCPGAQCRFTTQMDELPQGRDRHGCVAGSAAGGVVVGFLSSPRTEKHGAPGGARESQRGASCRPSLHRAARARQSALQRVLEWCVAWQGLRLSVQASVLHASAGQSPSTDVVASRLAPPPLPTGAAVGGPLRIQRRAFSCATRSALASHRRYSDQGLPPRCEQKLKGPAQPSSHGSSTSSRHCLRAASAGW